jgi:hypothetical protein
VSSSIHPIADATTYAEDGSGCAVSTCDIAAAPGRTTSAIGALDASSSVCSPMDAANGGTSPAGVVAIPVLLSLASGVTLVDSWHVR